MHGIALAGDSCGSSRRVKGGGFLGRGAGKASGADLAECGEAVPTDGAGKGRLEAFEILLGAPLDGEVFLGGEARGACDGSREVNEADVLVGVGDAVDVKEARRDQGAGSLLGGRRAFADELDLEAAFLPDLAMGGLLGVLVELDVAAEWQPLAEATVEDEEDAAVIDDEHGDGEVDFLVEMRHGGDGSRDAELCRASGRGWAVAKSPRKDGVVFRSMAWRVPACHDGGRA